MSGRRILSTEDVVRVQQMYDQLNERGRRKFTLYQIAELLDVSHSTIWHVVNRLGTYRHAPRPKSDEELSKEALASGERMMKQAREMGFKRAECTKCGTVVFLQHEPPEGYVCATCQMGKEDNS